MRKKKKFIHWENRGNVIAFTDSEREKLVDIYKNIYVYKYLKNKVGFNTKVCSLE